MLKIIRKHQTGIMLIVAIIVIIAFAFLYDPNRDAYRTSDDAIQVFGKNYRTTEVSRIESVRSLLYGLQQYQYVFGMSQLDRRFGTLDNSDSAADFIFNTLILRHEADKLGIAPTDAEIEEAIKAVPVFQTEGQYDPGKFENIKTNLSRQGINLPLIYQAIGDTIRFEKLRELISSGILPSEPEVAQYVDAQNAKIFASIAKIPQANFEGEIEVTDADVQEYFDANGASLQSEEKRSLDYVVFRRPVREEASGEGEEATEAETEEAFKERTRTFALAINDFATTIVEQGESADLRALAAAPGLTGYSDGVQSVEPFAQSMPPASLATNTALVESAFAHNMELGPIGDPIDQPDGFTFYKITAVAAPEPLPLEEARPQIEEALTAQKLAEKTSEAAAQAKDAIAAALAEGKDFAEAAEAAGYPAEEVPMFSSNQRPQGIPEAAEVAGAVGTLSPGEVSSPVTTADGAILVYLDARELPLDPVTDAVKETTGDQVGRIAEQAAFSNWFGERKQEAQPVILQQRS